MADPTKAEIMLDQVTKINALIRRFQLCKDHPIPPLRLDMKASLEQGKNLLITTFPVVDLYPDPNCDY